MNAAAGQKHRVARAHGNAMNTFRHFAGLDFLLKFRAGDATFQTDEQFRPRRGIGDEPHLGLRLAAQFSGLACGRMHLQRQFFARIEDFAEQGKRSPVAGFTLPSKSAR